jgi:signal transduction histidine kinase
MARRFETLLSAVKTLQVFDVQVWRSVASGWIGVDHNATLPRLVIGFAAVVIVTIIITILILRLGTTAIDSAFENFSMLNEFDEEVDEAARLTATVQVAGHLFRAERTTETMSLWRNDLKDVTRVLGHLKYHTPGERPALAIAEAETGIRRYEGSFRRFVTIVEELGFSHDEGLQGAFRAEAHALERTLVEMGDPRLVVDVLAMRRHEKDFLLRRHPDYSAKFSAVGERLQDRLRSSPAGAAATRHLAAYRNLFQQYVIQSGKIDSRFAEAERDIAAVLSILSRLKGHAQDGITTAEGTFAAGRAQIQTTTLLGIVLLLGVAAAICGLMLRRMVNLVHEAERLGRTKGEFLSMMGHELRTPLNAIIGFTDLMRKEVFGPLQNSRYTNYISLTNAAGRQLLQLVNDVLELAAVDQHRKVATENVLVGALVEKSIRYLTAGGANPNANVTASIDDTLAVAADPVMLTRCLIAVIGNAVKFTGKAGTVTVKATRHGPDRIAIAVSDTGIGIPRAMLLKVTQPFFQVDRGHTRRFDGGGIGLSVVKQLVGLNRGELAIESELNKGTVVTITLPAAVDTPAAEQEAASPTRPPSATSRANAAVGQSPSPR